MKIIGIFFGFTVLFAMASASAFAASECTLTVRWGGQMKVVDSQLQEALQKKGYSVVESHGKYTLESGRCLGAKCDSTEASLLQGQPPFLKVVTEVRHLTPKRRLKAIIRPRCKPHAS